METIIKNIITKYEKFYTAWGKYLSNQTNGNLKYLSNAIDKLTDEVAELQEVLQPEINFDKIEFDLPFDSADFKKEWLYWKEYLAEQWKTFYSSRAEKIALKFLTEYSENNEQKAIFILQHAEMTRAKNFYKITKEIAEKPTEIIIEDRGGIL